jgi:AcrR family transcriptional regulator
VLAARDAFARADAMDEPLSMNEVARTAGVGVATLYRHFATREDLANAVYESKLNELTAGVIDAGADAAGLDTLRSWVVEFAHFMLATRGMMDTLRAAWTSSSALTSSTSESIAATVGQLLEAAKRDGTARSDVGREEVAVGVLALLGSAAPGSDGARAVRLLELFIDGIAAVSGRA